MIASENGLSLGGVTRLILNGGWRVTAQLWLGALTSPCYTSPPPEDSQRAGDGRREQPLTRGRREKVIISDVAIWLSTRELLKVTTTAVKHLCENLYVGY